MQLALGLTAQVADSTVKEAADEIIQPVSTSIIENILNKGKIAVGVALIAGVLYLVYKKINPSNHNQIRDCQVSSLVYPKLQYDPQQISEIQTKSFQDTYNQLKCPLTLKLIADPATIKCGHTFQKGELIKALQKDPRCPTCRMVSQPQDIIRSILTVKCIQKFRQKVNKRGKQWAKQRIVEDFGDDQFEFQVVK